MLDVQKRNDKQIETINNQLSDEKAKTHELNNQLQDQKNKSKLLQL